VIMAQWPRLIKPSSTRQTGFCRAPAAPDGGLAPLRRNHSVAASCWWVAQRSWCQMSGPGEGSCNGEQHASQLEVHTWQAAVTVVLIAPPLLTRAMAESTEWDSECGSGDGGGPPAPKEAVPSAGELALAAALRWPPTPTPPSPLPLPLSLPPPQKPQVLRQPSAIQRLAHLLSLPAAASANLAHSGPLRSTHAAELSCRAAAAAAAAVAAGAPEAAAGPATAVPTAPQDTGRCAATASASEL